MPPDPPWALWALNAMPTHMLPALLLFLFALALTSLFAVLHFVAPKPRPVAPSEKTYTTSSPSGAPTSPQPLPCWYDRWLAERRLLTPQDPEPTPEPAQVLLSVVIPAYNEQDRIEPTLDEAVAYLDAHFGRAAAGSPPRGYEILVVDDGSRDGTVGVVLGFAQRRGLHDVLRVVSLTRNRGKGGSVTHGLRHVRGLYALFADADGASRFCDVARLMEGIESVVDSSHRGLAIGSRAHLVGSDAVVKRSALRNLLMRCFHLVLTILTPPATSRIRDTQCGFKLLTRAALPHIVPYMHTEGWIFDIEMLMLAESAPATGVVGSGGAVVGTSPGIRIAEVPVEWHEVGGSKLNVVQDSVRMALGLAVLRASWMMGVYRRRVA